MEGPTTLFAWPLLKAALRLGFTSVREAGGAVRFRRSCSLQLHPRGSAFGQKLWKFSGFSGGAWDRMALYLVTIHTTARVLTCAKCVLRLGNLRSRHVASRPRGTPRA